MVCLQTRRRGRGVSRAEDASTFAKTQKCRRTDMRRGWVDDVDMTVTGGACLQTCRRTDTRRGWVDDVDMTVRVY
jgi:hypothetical protein